MLFVMVDLIDDVAEPLAALHDEPAVLSPPASLPVASTPLAVLKLTPLGDRWAAVVGEMVGAGSIGVKGAREKDAHHR
jgi:hypothetical protein